MTADGGCGDVAHRDVEPASLLLAEDRVVLTDFGIAAVHDETALTAAGQPVGSPDCLAPVRTPPFGGHGRSQPSTESPGC